MATARFRVGNLELVVMSDGSYFLDAGAVFGIVPRERWEPFAGPIDSHHRFALGTNCLATRSRARPSSSRPVSATNRSAGTPRRSNKATS